MKRCISVLLIGCLLLLAGCGYDDGRTNLRGIWVIKDAAVEGEESDLQSGVYMYMEFQKNGVMYMGRSTTGPIAAYTYMPLAQKNRMRLTQVDYEPQEWAFWFEGTHLMMEQVIEGEQVHVNTEGEVHEHDEEEESPPMELIPLDEYLESLKAEQ